jgi:hypothetical protein
VAWKRWALFRIRLFNSVVLMLGFRELWGLWRGELGGFPIQSLVGATERGVLRFKRT